MQVPAETKDAGAPRSWSDSSCEPPDMGRELGLLEEQYVILTTEVSLQFSLVFFFPSISYKLHVNPLCRSNDNS